MLATNVRLLLPALFLLVAPAAAQNLLQNPSAEEPLDGSEIPGWTEVVGTTWTYRAANPPPHDGKNYFFPGAVASAELAQDVDVSDFAETIDDGEQAFVFRGRVRTFPQSPSDQSRIVVEYRDDEETVLDSYDSGDVANSSEWVPLQDQRTAPVGTRTVRVRLIATRFNGSNNDGYFDALSLVPTSGDCTLIVTTADDSGPGSLRHAINEANAAADADVVCFAIPGDGPHTIALASALPAITQPVVIDGYTQPGASENTLAVGSDAALQVTLDGSAAGDDVNGVLLTGSGITVRGLAVGDFDGDLVRIEGGGENVVEGMWLGTDATGTAVREGNSGVWIVDSPNNVIGGTTPAARNVVSGDTGGGFYVFPGSDGTQILNTYIGTDPAGAASLGGNGGGIFILGADDTVIGAPGAGNVIAGFDGGRLFVLVEDGDPAERTVIQGNHIGTNAIGDAALGDSGGGIFIEGAPNTLLGGAGEGEGNLISAGDQEGGVFIYDETIGDVTYTSAGTVVQGNLVGTDATGTVALNQCCGIDVASAHVLIGGTEPGARNVISGNTSDGISVADSVTVLGNYIGVDVSGTEPLGNGFGGIWISGDGNQIGGIEPGAGNVIAATGPGDGGSGIIVRFGATGNVIEGNFIGTNAEGDDGLGNDYGITFESADTSDNRVGGTAEGSGNVIAHNVEVGVYFTDAGSGNAILGNSIHSNGGLGISLTFDGPTENDPGDEDDGPNGLQNYPVLTADGPGAVSGTLDSTPETTFRVEFFANAEADPSGHGEGEVFLGFVEVTTDASGQADFTFDLPADVLPFVAATATAPDGSTSEFSAAVQLPVSNEPEAGLPAVSALHAPYPNPTSGTATLAFALAEAGPVRLVVYDVLGRAVAVLVDEERSTGRYEVALDGRSLPSGIYLLRMTAGGFAQTQRVVLSH